MPEFSIFKYELAVVDLQTVWLPARHRVLCVQSEGHVILMWALVVPESGHVKLPVRIFGTGQPIELSDLGSVKYRFDYAGTCREEGGMVWHVFVPGPSLSEWMLFNGEGVLSVAFTRYRCPACGGMDLTSGFRVECRCGFAGPRVSLPKNWYGDDQLWISEDMARQAWDDALRGPGKEIDFERLKSECFHIPDLVLSP